MRPLYELTIDNSKKMGVDFNSFVDVPAHLKGFIAFGSKQKPLSLLSSKPSLQDQRLLLK